jgi:hypothetical protein
LESSPASPTVAGVTVGRELGAGEDACSNSDAGEGGCSEEAVTWKFKRAGDGCGVGSVGGGVGQAASRIQLRLPSDAMASAGVSSEMCELDAFRQHPEYRHSILGADARGEAQMQGGGVAGKPDDEVKRRTSAPADDAEVCINVRARVERDTQTERKRETQIGFSGNQCRETGERTNVRMLAARIEQGVATWRRIPKTTGLSLKKTVSERTKTGQHYRKKGGGALPRWCLSKDPFFLLLFV